MILLRAFLLALLIATSAATAHEMAVDDCAVNADRECAVEVTLSGLVWIAAEPVVVAPDRLRFLAEDATRGVVLVDLSTTDGQVVRQQPLDMGGLDYVMLSGLIAPEGQTVALSLWQEDGGYALQFFSADGAQLGQVPAIRSDGWTMEISLTEALMLLGGQNLLRFDDTAIQGEFYRFRLRAGVADGSLEVKDLAPPSHDGDTLSAYLERRLAGQLDPVGHEDAFFEGPLSAVTTTASDGSPSRVLLRSTEGGEIAFDQGLGPERGGFDYLTARVAPDGRFLAVARDGGAAGRDPATELMLFDARTTFPAVMAPLPAGWPHLVWLPDGRIAVLAAQDGPGIGVVVFSWALPDP